MRHYFFVTIDTPDEDAPGVEDGCCDDGACCTAEPERDNVIDLGSGSHGLKVFVVGDDEPFEVDAPCGPGDLAEAIEVARGEGFTFVLVDGDAIRCSAVSGVVLA